MSKGHKILFTLSILLNVVLGGVMLGHAYRAMQESPWGEMRGELSPETRQIMREAYKEKRKEIWAMRDEMKKKSSALKGAITSEDFDAKAFEAAASDMKSHNEKAFDSRVDTFTKVLSQLSIPERKKMAQRTVDILAGHRKWDKSAGKDRMGPPPPEDQNPFAKEDDNDKDHRAEKPHHGKKKPKD